MALYVSIEARNHAATLIIKALESGSIKLGGPHAGETVEEAGQRDAAYLAALTKNLVAKLTE